MNSVGYIRSKVFGVTQAAFAGIAGVSQPTVSRWEEGTLEPNRDQMDSIRAEAVKRGIDWQDSWFFDQPPLEDAAERRAS